MTQLKSQQQTSMTPLCILVPAGPGAEEIKRVADLMESARAYSDLPLCAVIINDQNDASALTRACSAQQIPAHILPNARRARGDWWTGGLCMAMLDALLWIGRNLSCRGVLRMDSDALIINPFASQLCDLFSAAPTTGIVGNYDSLTGAPVGLGHIMTTRLYWRSKWLSYDKENKKLILSLWSWRRRLRYLIKAAQSQGYPLGEWVQGGAYGLSPHFISQLVGDPRFSNPEHFLHVDLCEDTFMTLIVYALGLKAHYTVGPTRLFASTWKGLFDEPEALVKAGHGIVHSVKDYGNRQEVDLRIRFKRLRTAAQPSISRHIALARIGKSERSTPTC